MAIEEYTKAIQLQPDYVLAYKNRASAHIVLGQSTLAIESYDSIIQLEPDNACAYHSRGNLIGGFAAIKDYDKALEIDPDNALVYRSRGYQYYFMGYKNDAKVDWNRSDEISGSVPTGGTTRIVNGISSTLPHYSDGLEC
jgi:tetratricopeptide (TPR) repeat protein